MAWYTERSVLLAIFMISTLLVIRHSDNINKLLSGKESRLNFGNSADKKVAEKKSVQKKSTKKSGSSTGK